MICESDFSKVSSGVADPDRFFMAGSGILDPDPTAKALFGSENLQERP